MISEAVYVTSVGTADAPRSRIGLCPLDSVPTGPDTVFIVISPDADEIYSLAGKVASPTMERPTGATYECERTPDDAAMCVKAACEVDTIGGRPFRFRIHRNWVI